MEATNSAVSQLSWNLGAIYCKQKQEPQVVTSHCLVLKSLWTVSVLSFSYVFGCSDLLMGSPSPLPAFCLVLLSLTLFLPGFIHCSGRGCWPFSQDFSFPQTRRIVSGKLMALKQSCAFLVQGGLEGVEPSSPSLLPPATSQNIEGPISWQF